MSVFLRAPATACRVGVVVIALAAGCHGGDGHDHAAGEAHGTEEAGDEVEPLAITIWTDEHELFVEFPPPAPNQPVRHHAHVTRIADNHAATEGSFAVRFKNASGVAAETSIDKVARAGIFTPEGKAPGAGEYTLEMAYTVDGATDVFDCGSVEVTNEPSKPVEGVAGISFLKESQWKIAFTTAWAPSARWPRRSSCRRRLSPPPVTSSPSVPQPVAASSTTPSWPSPRGSASMCLVRWRPAVTSVIRSTGRAERDEHAMDVNFSELEVGLDLSQGDREELLAEIRREAAAIPGLAVTVGQPISHRIEHLVSGVG